MRGKWLGTAGLLAGLFACEGTQREFVSGPLPGKEGNDPLAVGETAGAADGDAAGQSGPAEGVAATLGVEGRDESIATVLPPGSLGTACAADADCNAPGLCVDGVCCSSDCTDLCAACNLPGSLGACSAAPSDSACAQLQCPGYDTECRALDASQLALNCESFGVCRANAECAITPMLVGTPCQAGAGSCDGEGACLVAGKLRLGEACGVDDECAEGHCVAAGEAGAFICCDAACDGPCQACSSAGFCEDAPSSDPSCDAVTCPADDVCRAYATATENLCRGFGQCQTVQDCPFTRLRPNAECSCDPSAGCTLTLGAACASDGECGSGTCLANVQGASVCCASSCADGLSCSRDGTDCVACEGPDIQCEGTIERRCNAGAAVTLDCANGCTPGVGCNALPPVGFPCDAGQCASPGLCQQDVAGQARCCSRDCAAEGKVCADNGSCVCGAGQIQAGSDCLLQDGDPCTGDDECQPGSLCTDGVCCQEACDGACERCQANTGLCVAVGAGQQDNLCNGGRQCMGGRGDCRLNLRQQCFGSGADCASDNCEPTVGNNTQICCAQSCSGDRPFCRSDGNSCTQCESNADCPNGCNLNTGLCQPLLTLGAPCGNTSQCAGNASCLLDQNRQTRCCERNCAAVGQVCNGNGRCIVPTVGVGQPCTDGVVNCTGNFRCINNTCQLPVVGQGQACGAAAICDGALGLECRSGVCDCPANRQFANGRCVNPAPPNLVASTATIDFGTGSPLNAFAPVAWTITNNGGTVTNALSLSGVGNTQLFPTEGACPPLQPAQSCTITISFVPDLISGVFNYAATWILVEIGTGRTVEVDVTGGIFCRDAGPAAANCAFQVCLASGSTNCDEQFP